MKIDAHHHFWHPARGDYHWMAPDDPVLSRPYGPADLASALIHTGVEKTVLVQAAASVEETHYLLGLADATPHVAGVVGWINFEDLGHRAALQRFAAHPKFLGVRPMIQDIPEDAWMLRADLTWAFEALIEMDLTFDALGFPRHIAPFLALFARHPSLRVVLDHGLKPQIGEGAFEPWASGMTRLARETGAFVKLSGLVTEAGADASDAALTPYVAHLLDSFGPERVMWGSDWPVARKVCDYAPWHAQAERLCAGLPAADKARVFGGTAQAFYRLNGANDATT